LLDSKKIYDYINTIKQQKKIDVYTVVNTTVIANPYISNFPKELIFNKHKKVSKLKLFVVSVIKFYAFHFVHFIFFIRTFFYYRFLYKKPKYEIVKNALVIDVYFLVDRIIKDEKLHEGDFSSLYGLLKKKNIDFVFLPRLNGLSTNPLKAHQQLKYFFKIINEDHNNFLFEFELLSFKDFFYLIWLILCYPFKTLKLIVKEESQDDKIFNINLLKDISNQSIYSFSRYIFGRNISKIRNINKIYSWSEFQNLERSFNYAIRKNSNIKIIACQFYINYPAYLNTVVQDIDELLGYAPHQVLVNGKEYLVDNNIDYQLGVSLRYNKVFKYQKGCNGSSTIVLGSYFIDETNNLLRVIQGLDNVVFKGHPAIHISTIRAYLLKGIQTTNEDIYDLFPNAGIVVGAASGSLLEAVVCGASVIVVAQKDELITNPLVDFGKGKIWDIVFSKAELKIKYRELLVFRENNPDEINIIADWYKDNFFVEPTVENISKVFELE
jgi:hypothetical protein